MVCSIITTRQPLWVIFMSTHRERKRRKGTKRKQLVEERKERSENEEDVNDSAETEKKY